MRRLTHAVVLALAPSLLVACGGDTARPTDPLAARAPGTRGAAETFRLVNMKDACDPQTFNAALGPGTCTRQGGVSFSEFIAQLTRHRDVGAWHFAPPSMTARVGHTLLAVNRGGEVHTFTEVEEFGGGIVPELNQLSGQTTVAPECEELDADDFVPPGGTFADEVEHTGTERYQCCIHPWMRLTVQVKH